MSTRKRGRASLSDNLEEDELSPTKNLLSKSPFGATKKRKLNPSASVPNLRSETPKVGFVGRLSGLFGYGAGRRRDKAGEKENEPDDEDDDDRDELGHIIGTKKPVKDVWDVPDEDSPVLHPPSGVRRTKSIPWMGSTSHNGKVPRAATVTESDESSSGSADEIAVVRKSGQNSTRGAATNGRKSANKSVHRTSTTVESKSPNKAIVLDSNSSDSASEVNITTSVTSTPKPGANSSTTDKRTTQKQKGSDTTIKRGRPSQTAQNKVKESVRDTDESSSEDPEPPSSSKRASGPNGSGKPGEVPSAAKATRGRPKKLLEKANNMSKDAKSSIEANIESSPKRTPRKPRTADILRRAKQLSRQNAKQRLVAGGDKVDDPSHDREVEDTSQEEFYTPDTHKKGKSLRTVGSAIRTENYALKGILTPTRRGDGPRTMKSVVFEDVAQADLGFKDLPKSVRKMATIAVADESPAQREIEAESTDSSASEDDDETDEDKCSVCAGLDSKKPNLMLLCDGCDMAVHQLCYGVTKIPKGDWFCNKCMPKLGTSGPDAAPATGELAKLPDIADFENNLYILQELLLGRLTGNRLVPLRGHDEEMEKVYQVVKQTVLAGEGNSMMVIGARGSGKTTLVESVISSLSDHRESFHVVRLDGFIHTDDKLALKEIWRQLGREMEVEDDGKASANDTLQSLLALLSHPSDFMENEEGHAAKSVVFIMNEFDLFTTHSRQTLLYNLFDIAQARKAPIVVLGLTTRVDVVEALEKRVKSRFSHRYVHLSLPRSVPGFWEICQGALKIDSDDLVSAGHDPKAPGMEDCMSFWQTMVADLFKDPIFKHHLETLFYRTKSVSAFFTSCIIPIASLSTTHFPLTALDFTPSNSLTPPDSKLDLLQGLSELERAMLISAARLDIILDTDTCNFSMVYDEYSSLMLRHKIQTSSSGINATAAAKIWGRDIALGAWERLADYHLLVPAGIGGGAARDLGAGGRMWKVDVGLEEIAGSISGLNSVMAKWCREI